MDMPYGDRRAMVKDSWGNIWQIATHKEDLSAEEVRARMGAVVDAIVGSSNQGKADAS
jgi:hypothetical protein